MSAADRGEPGAPSGCARRLLIVEDEMLVRLDLGEAFREAGFLVTECASADEALRLVCAGAAFGAVVTDVRMPGAADGLQLAAHVKSTSPETLVIVCSGEAALASLAAGFDGFYAKPFCVDMLVATLGRLLPSPDPAAALPCARRAR